MNYYAIPGLIRDTFPTEKLVTIVAECYEIPESEIMARNRKQPGAEARHLVCFLLRKIKRWDFDRIGGMFNNDHTTAIHAVKAVGNRIETRDERTMHIAELLLLNHQIDIMRLR